MVSYPISISRCRITRFVVAACVLLLGCGTLFGGASPKNIVATRTSVPPRSDGRLDDPAWASAVPVMGFTQFDPEEGAPPTEETSVRILYDDDAIYVGVLCRDTDPSGIISQLTRRDRSTQSDRFSVIIDSYHDHSTAFLFSGSVSGVQSDGLLSQDGLVYDLQWDAVWKFDAALVPEGWSAEFTIPYSALRFAEQDGEYVWGINFRRYIGRKKETDEWVMLRRADTPPGTISSVSAMGHLSGMTKIVPPLHLEIMPYEVSRAKYLSQTPPFPLQRELGATGGVDIKYGLTRNMTLDMAINPDFGQVEVDQAVLNLSVFETFYPEKRPFFLEGSQIFSFGNVFDNEQLRLFYSRRIGKSPVPPGPSPGTFYVEHPQTTTILGAGKLTGKTSDGLSIGVMSALTRKEEGVEEDLYGVRSAPILFEPQASYNILRLQKDLSDNATVGMMATGAFRDRNAPVMSGGVDWNTRFGEGTYAFDGYLAGSRVNGPAGGADRLSGSAGRFGLGKLADTHLLWFTFYDYATRDFSINDLGFFNQANEHGGLSQLMYKQEEAAAPIRRYSLSLLTTYRWNWDGAPTTKQVEFEPAWEFRNFWYGKLNFVHAFAAYDDANRGIIGLYRRPEANRFTAMLQTDPRSPIVVTSTSGYTTASGGMSALFTTLSCTARLNSWVELVPSLTYASTQKEVAWPLYYYTSDGRNLFGTRDVDQYDLSLRGTVTFTRTISLQFFTQVFLAKGRYGDFAALAASDRMVPYAYDRSLGNPDFNEKVLNANLVFRWEYLPGSTAYLVWTQARYGDNGLYDRTLSDNIADAFKLPMDNVLLAKISYWWSL
jgi:hypothetical protein